jgi:hypothetical protein
MSDGASRVRRAFADHGGFEEVSPDEYVSTATAFDATATAEAGDDGRVRFGVEVRVPTLSAVVDGDVADVVEDGWYDTFELRVADVGGVTRAEHDLDPVVRNTGDAVVVAFKYEDLNERRGVDDAAALVTFVEGTFVQGVIPGYDYTDPVSSLLSTARQSGEF